MKQWSFRGDWPGPGPERDSTSITRKQLCQCRLRALKLIPSEVCGLGKEPPFFCLVVPRLLTWLKGAWGAGWSQRLGSQSFPWQQLRVAWHRHCMWCFSAGVRRGGSHGERAWGQSDSWARRRGPGRAGGGHCRGSGAVLLWSGVGHRGTHLFPILSTRGRGQGRGRTWAYGIPSSPLETDSKDLSRSPPTSLIGYLEVFPCLWVLIIEATPGLNWLAYRNVLLYIRIDQCNTHLSLTLFYLTPVDQLVLFYPSLRVCLFRKGDPFVTLTVVMWLCTCR